jgi:hypothetical protein
VSGGPPRATGFRVPPDLGRVRMSPGPGQACGRSVLEQLRFHRCRRSRLTLRVGEKTTWCGRGLRYHSPTSARVDARGEDGCRTRPGPPTGTCPPNLTLSRCRPGSRGGRRLWLRCGATRGVPRSGPAGPDRIVLWRAGRRPPGPRPTALPGSISRVVCYPRGAAVCRSRCAPAPPPPRCRAAARLATASSSASPAAVPGSAPSRSAGPP